MATLYGAGFGGAVLPGMLCASLFPAIIGSQFPGALYLTQTLNFRQPALVRCVLVKASPHAQSCPKILAISQLVHCWRLDQLRNQEFAVMIELLAGIEMMSSLQI